MPGGKKRKNRTDKNKKEECAQKVSKDDDFFLSIMEIPNEENPPESSETADDCASSSSTGNILEKTSQIKRKHKVLSLEEKLEIIKRLESGESIVSLAKHYNIGRATVFDIKAKKETLYSYASQFLSGDAAKRRKTMRRANDESLEQAVYLWYKERITNGQHVSGTLLSEKALELNKLLGGPEDFKASSGWLQNFKTRHGIATFNIKNPSPSADQQSDDYSFLEAYLNMMQQEGYDRDDIYTVETMQLNLKTMPRNSFFFQHESVVTRKSLEALTILTSANSTWSHSLPLLMVGKSEKEKCFRKVSCLPLIYRSQREGVIDQEIFLEWYANEFIPCVKKERHASGKYGKVLVLLHNAPFLPSADALNTIDEQFQVIFFPTNLSSFAPTMDKAVLKNLTQLFKVQVLNRLLMTAGSERSLVKLSKRLTLKDFSYMLADTWKSLAEEKMKEMSMKLWVSGETEKTDSRSNDREIKEVVETCKSIPHLTKCDVEDIRYWLNDDSAGDSTECPTSYGDESEIITPHPIDETIKVEGGGDGEEEDIVDDVPVTIPTHHEAIEALETAIEWCERQNECFPEQLILLKRLKDRAENKLLTVV